MANLAALKKKAADFEQKKQFDKAIAAYRELLDAYDAGADEDADVALYNRVGDLLARQGSTADAVTLYERAVDLYTEGGFFNNAIALCNKILRTSPGRATVYYKLGKISAAKGFRGDAKQNFLEYADRMQKSGQMPEAFRALKEFADLCPDQDDIRLMLAEQLTKADRKSEALEQLQLLYERYESEDRKAEAQATFARMKAIDPSAEVKTVTASRKRRQEDELIFIDLNAPTPRQTRRTKSATLPKAQEPPPPPPRSEPVSVPPPPPAAAAPPAAGEILGLERTAFGGTEVEESAPMQASEFAEMDLSAIREAPSSGDRASSRDLALPGDLPQIDERAGAGAERISQSLETVESAQAELRASLPFQHEGAPGVVVPPPDLEPTSADSASLLELGGVRELDLASLGPEPTVPSASNVEELVESAPETPTSFGSLELEGDEMAPAVRRTSSHLPNSAAMLAVRLETEPENWQLHREYAEALMEEGNRDAGLVELETALVGLERADDLEGARSVADEIIRLNPASVRHHQKRVEYAYRTNDKPRLAEAYIDLADSLFRDGQTDKAKVFYQRALEIAPDDARASAALDAFGPAPEATPEPAPRARPSATTKGRRYTATMDSRQAASETEVPSKVPEDEFISLGDWLRADEGPKSTRMVVAEEVPTGDEEADFADMLRKFKQGVAENVEEEDHEAHYDLGVAFKEMGLIDEAIVEFQKALRSPQHRVRTCEALGQCFLEKKQLPMAKTVLQRALNEPGAGDDQLVGVLYLLGYTYELLGSHADAKGFYERVFAIDIQFRDVGDRLDAVDKPLK